MLKGMNLQIKKIAKVMDKCLKHLASTTKDSQTVYCMKVLLQSNNTHFYQFKIISKEHIWSMTGGVDEGVLEFGLTVGQKKTGNH